MMQLLNESNSQLSSILQIIRQTEFTRNVEDENAHKMPWRSAISVVTSGQQMCESKDMLGWWGWGGGLGIWVISPLPGGQARKYRSRERGE